MSKSINLRKGFDIKVSGQAKPEVVELASETLAVKPTDFVGYGKPKMLVKEGDKVKAGTPLYYDKSLEAVKYTSPVSGEVVEVKRGAKRRLLEIKVLADKEVEYESFNKYSLPELSRLSEEEIKSQMANSGVWPHIIQRPYAVVANPAHTPKAIFVSGFDTAPLAPDFEVLFAGEEANFEAGMEVLKKLTSGKVHLNVNGQTPKVFAQAKGVEVNSVSGPHPAGNVGVQIHNIDPIGKGDLVWTVSPYGVIQIGKLFLEGKYDASRIVALTGSEVAEPKYYKTYNGASVDKLIDGKLSSKNVRIVSGNILSGEKVAKDSYVGFYDNQVTVIPEGDNYKFFGSFAPTSRLSFGRSLGLLSFLNRGKEHVLDSNINGEHRAFVQTGVMEQVLPMDIYPVYLLKAILAEDFEEMEALGIYEVAEEDFALCEFVDVSKHEVQSIIRRGIDLMLNS